MILVRNNSSLPIVKPELANEFLSKPRVNTPAGADRATSLLGLKTTRGLMTSRPQTGTGAWREQTRFGGAGNPGRTNDEASSNNQCSVSKEQKE